MIIFWRIFYPLVALAAAPFWMLKMLRRDGWGSGLLERIGIYRREVEFERIGAVYIHAVSVGEVLLALKVITEWRKETGDHFVLVPTTATGMAVARDKSPKDVRVIYAPLDFGFLIRRVMKRLEPRVVVMVESEIWPNLIYETHRLGIPIGLMNARLSPRSGRRLKKFQSLVSPFLELLDYVGVPEKEDLVRWRSIGVREKAAVLTGNVKFDPSGSVLPEKRSEFSAMLEQFPKRPVAMAISTFPGEEEYLDDVFRELGYQSVIVPRHAERRTEVAEALAKHRGWLHLDGLQSLSPEVATALSKHQGWLFLNGIKVLDKDVAVALLPYRGQLYLDSVQTITDDVAEIIVKRRHGVELYGVRNINYQSVAMLRKNSEIVLPAKFNRAGWWPF